ncbi:hypothetical protein [Streptomyces sp. MAR4 CNX-425]|uniref:hypothetical protein n=1 Tax=Streptomyces sp. MAR4 CNX-425 TaxID=3406343 RepID=UPI003B50C378
MTGRPLSAATATAADAKPTPHCGKRAQSRTALRSRTSTGALAIAALLLLASCGGSDDGGDDGDKIAGAKPSSTPSESPTETEESGRPEIKLPDGSKNVFEAWEVGDPKKNAVLADSAESINSVDDAIFQGKAQTEALAFYNSGTALQDSIDYIKRWVGEDDTWIGSTRYFDHEVSFLDDGSAVVIYCIDQSKAFIKDGKTEEVDRSPASKDSYALTNTRLVENEEGVWQTVEIEAKRGASECHP